MKKRDSIESIFAADTKKYVGIMEVAISNDDFKTYYIAKEKLEEAVDTYKRNKKLEGEVNTTNFFQLNHVFENALPKLFFNDRPTVAKVIKLIKEDKNLVSQFSFLNGIRNYCKHGGNTIDSGEMLHMLESLVSENLDKDSVMMSNIKLKNMMIECGVMPDDFIDKEKKELYEAFNNVLTKKVTSDNIISIADSRNKIKAYLDENKNTASKTDIDADKVMSNFENNMNEGLNSVEANLVMEIIESSTDKKEEIFNKFKKECINKIDSIIESDGENKELSELKNSINERKFDESCIAEEISKLIEIRSILNED